MAVLATLLLGILAAYYIPIFNYGFFSVISVVTPYLTILFGLCCVAVWFWKPKFGIIGLLFFLVIYFALGRWYELSLTDNKNIINTSSGSTYHLMTFNAHGFNKHLHYPKDTQVKLIEFLNQNVVDILCIQEYSRERYKYLKGYSYISQTPFNKNYSVQAILTKHKIVREGSLNVADSFNNIIFADILLGTDTVRVYNFHLQSFNLNPSDMVQNAEAGEYYFERIKKGMSQQEQQVDLLHQHLAQNPIDKVILAGDLNNTQFSRVYKKLSKGYQDSFKAMGQGFGKTFEIENLPLRIDYLFFNSHFEILSHQNYKMKLSDHYPVQSSFKIRP